MSVVPAIQMRAMSLSLCLVTVNSSAFVEKLLAGAHAYADELVVAVDVASTDETEALCARYADRLLRVDIPGPSLETVLGCVSEQCTADWILRLDDDELRSESLVAALPSLLADRGITHYWLRRRWIIGEDRAAWIAQHPWSPDWQLRLFRNLPSIVNVPGELHTSCEVQGDGRYVPEGCIYHFDLVYHTDAERRAKVERYERLRPSVDSRQYYLPSIDDLVTGPIPANDAPWLRPAPAREGRSAPRSERTTVSGARWDCSGMQSDAGGRDVFHAAVSVEDCPGRMRPAIPLVVDVQVRNDSGVPWPAIGRGEPRVRLSYHWLLPNGDVYEYDGLRADLPHKLSPGQSTVIPSPVQPPAQSGRFRIRWDLVIENVAWFSDHGLSMPEADVLVEPDCVAAGDEGAASSPLGGTKRGAGKGTFARDQ